MPFLRPFVLASGLALSAPALACDLALVLAVDISGSVDSDEYDTQMQGIAAGLRDGVVSEALLRAQAKLMLVQWTGSSRQAISVHWTQIETFEDIETLARQIAQTPRVWRNYSTAIGEALDFTLAGFGPAMDCKRRVIDLSGDGISNEGVEPREMQAAMTRSGITVNALVVEGAGAADVDLTGYFWENVIIGPGAFVVTANGFSEYAEKMRQKLVRETARQVAGPTQAGPTRAQFRKR